MKKRKRAYKAPKVKDPFVKVPLWFAVEAAKATRTSGALVWIWLLYQGWRDRKSVGRDAVRMANAKLKSWGVSRNVKQRVLRDLERAGLIEIERRPRKSPNVTLKLL